LPELERPDREELSAVVKRSLFKGAGGESAARAATFIEQNDAPSGGFQGGGGGKSGQAGANDNAVFEHGG
jgi:hypothetical protein